MKDAYYFSHDSSAKDDPKCSALIAEYGLKGYGLYWVIIETLAQQADYKLKKFKKMYLGLAHKYLIDEEELRSIVEAMLHDYDLLVQDDDFIWSESLLRRMDEKRIKKDAKASAGRLGGIRSGISRGSTMVIDADFKQIEAETKQNEAMLQAESSTLEANEPKERKVKESKVKESINTNTQKISFASKVLLSNDEHQKLLSKYGQDDTDRMIEILENYKLSSGKKYESDYHAILNWVVKRLNEEKQKKQDVDNRSMPRAFASIKEYAEG